MTKKPAFLRDYDWIHFQQEYSKSDDRSCAILFGSYIDNCVYEVLIRIVNHKRDFENKLLAESRPLGSFSSRIDLLWSLGFLPKEIYHDLHLLRKIRNNFAHDLTLNSFAQEPIKSWCLELRLPKLRSSEELYKDLKVDFKMLFIISGALCDGMLNTINP